MKNKKIVITITSIVAVLLVIIGVTYAYWLLTKTQTGHNLISSGCLDISLTGEKNDIELQDQFPLSDEDGMKLTPYEFTVTNNCNTSVDYQVNLESIGDSTNAIKASAIKVALNDEIKLLTAGGNTEPTVSGAYESNMILYGTLAAKDTENASVTYKLRIWIDANAPISEQNKTFQSKISVTVGQGITNPYKEGTLAYDILSNYGGADAIASLSAEWTEGDASAVTATTNNVGTSNNYWYGTSYTFDKETGYYTLSGTLTQATLTECRNGTNVCGKYTLKNESSTYNSSYLYEITDFGTSGDYIPAKTIKGSNAFSVVTASSDAGLYKAQDDLGTSYYFRGAPTNNYVQFGTYAADTTITFYDETVLSEKTVEVKAGTPMYWRIVRINGDGSIRLIYDGTEKVVNGVAHTAVIGMTPYTTNYDYVKYAGYTYDVDGTETNSTVKGVVDAWYDKHLNTTYGKYIADSIFCNDRGEVTTDESGRTYYAPYYRLSANKAPVLTCTNKDDRYTVSTELGNGKLTDAEGNVRPIGLLTADEAIMAGAPSFNNTHYLYSGGEYWTSTPDFFNKNVAWVWSIDKNGSVQYEPSPYGVVGARPVINLKADVKFTGDGRIDTNSPYEIVLN
ncbi:MAG: hypothetical protein IJN03_01345 [Bacilli bacterium]|nr:hypothetical protein [Bacilli bacterium]